MADDFWLEKDFESEFGPSDPYSEGTDWSDYAKVFAERSFGIGTDLGAALRSAGEGSDSAKGIAAEAFGTYFQSVFGDWEDKTFESLSPDAKRRVQSTVTNPAFWSATTLALKATGMAPDVVAAVVPSTLFPGAIAATIAASAAGGGLAAASVIDDIHEITDSMADAELQAEVPYYKALRQQGMPEKQARADYNRMALGAAPQLTFALTAATSVFGPAGQIARSIAGKPAAVVAGSTLKGRVGRGVGAGAISEAIQEGGQEYLTQEAQIRGGLQDEIDYDRIATGAAEGAVMGGILGGVAGVPRPRTLRDNNRDASNIATDAPIRDEDSSAIDAEQAYAMASQTQRTTPVPGADVRPTGVPGVSGATAPVASDPRTMPSTGPGNVPGATVPPVPADSLAARTPILNSTTAEDVAIGATITSGAPAPDVTPRGNLVRPKPGIINGKKGDTALAVARRRKNITVVDPVAPPPDQAAALSASRGADTPPPVTDTPSLPQAGPLAGVQGAPATTLPENPNASVAPLPEARRGVAPSTPSGVSSVRVQSPAGPATGAGPAVIEPPLADPVPPVAEAHVAPVPAPRPSPPPEGMGDRRATGAVTSEVIPPEDLPPVAPAAIRSSAPRAPRILETGPEYNWGAQVAKNIKGMSEPETKVSGRNRTRAELEVRANANDQATGIIQRHVPADDDALAISPAKSPAAVRARTQARSSIMGRAKAMVAEATSAGVTIPKALRDNARSETDYNDAVFLLVEAQRLAGKANPTRENFERFITREADIRSGAASAAKAERRAEGEAAMRQDQGDVEEAAQGNLEEIDQHASADTLNPEEALIRAEEEGAETKQAPPDTSRERPNIFTAQHVRAVTAPKVTPKVEAIRRRKVVPPKAVPPKAVPRSLAPAAPAAPLTQEKRIGLKGEQIVAKIKAKQAQARKDTDPNPTDAQALAGNAVKGEVPVHGMTVTIETPKGATRRNRDPDGPAWAVRMKKADYGYINRTEGVDGDQIDVYLGSDHDATYAYIIDQKDPDTNTFDEHKVMLSFATQAQAVSAYYGAFSDNRGMQRLGDIRKVSIDELKEWLTDPKVKTKTRAGITASDEAEANYLSLPEPEISAAFITPQGNVTYDVRTGRSAEVIAYRKAGDVLEALNFENMVEGPRVLAQHVKKSIMNLVKDVDVFIVTRAKMAKLEGSDLMGTDRRGVVSARGMYNEDANGRKWIIIRDDQLEDMDAFRHTVLHEAVHAATLRNILTNAELQSDINEVRRALHGAARGDRGMADIARYSLQNNGEFVAEANSNPELQQLLASIQAPQELVSRLQLRSPTLWEAVVTMVRRALGIPKGAHTLLDAAMRVSERSMVPNLPAQLPSGVTNEVISANLLGSVTNALRGRINETLNRPEMQATTGNEWMLRWRTFDNIARAADRYFPNNNPVRILADLVEGMRVAAITNLRKAEGFINGNYALQKKYEKIQGVNNRSLWQDYVSLLHDETMAGVFADTPLEEQTHLTKNGMRDVWNKAQHDDLSERYEALPDELKDARQRNLDFYREQQNTVSVKLIRNGMLPIFGDNITDPDGMAQRIHEGTATDADKAFLGDAYETIAAANVLSKIDGPYYPQMRRGNWVVNGLYKVTASVTSGGNYLRRISDNEFEFATREQAEAFVQDQPTRTTLRSVHVHKNTGETFGVTSDGTQVPLTSQDFDAVQRFRAVVQNKHVEFFDTEREARERVAELRRSPAFQSVEDAAPRRFERNGPQADMLSTQTRKLADILDRKAGERGYTSQQRHDMTSTLNEMSLHMLASTRIQTRRLPRRYVAGASKDFSRNALDYAQSMAGYNAKLDFQPKIGAALTALREAADHGPSDGRKAARVAIANEIEARIAGNNGMQESATSPAIQRILAVSFLDKLMSPSYAMVSATQPVLITMPVLAGRFGVGRSYSAMSRAYSDVGFGKSIASGVRETISRARNPEAIGSDPVSLIRSRLTKRDEQAFIDIMVERGVIDANAGLELDRLRSFSNKGLWGRFDQGIGYLEGIARQMPKTVEAINRTVAGLAAYRLELERSGDVARATQYGQDVVNSTQFNYSATNAPAIFNNPIMRLALQFKKHGQGMYSLMGEQIARAVRNENPGDRAEALRSFSYMIGMHVLVAGAMGLPSEPIRMAVTAANALGLTDWTWSDVEAAQRDATADIFGKKFGEIISRGITRALPDSIAIDLSSRLGIDTLMGGFGEPRSNEAQDWKAYMFDLIGGAPTALVMDMGQGMNLLASGEVLKASEKLVPIKLVADSIKSYRTLTEGKTSKTGRETMSPYSVGEAAIRTLGFTPAREAESSERSATFYRARDRQENARSELQREWLDATTAARGRLWREIRTWNKGQPREVRLSLSDLRSYQKRMKADMKKTVEGLRARRREEHILERVDETFNFSR